MWNTVKINEEMTKQSFGYDLSDLINHPNSMVVVECINCHTLIRRQFRNALKRHQCSVVDGNNKKCFACKTWKDLSLFNKSRNGSGGVAKMCRECYNKHDAVIKCEKNRLAKRKNAFHEDIDYYIEIRYNQVKNRCNKSNIPFNLEKKDLVDLWNQQDRKCFYSNIEMVSQGKIQGFQGWNAPSLDRKTPALGYTKGNVVWTIFAVNSFKQSLNETEFKEKIKLIKWWFENKI